MLYNTNWWSCGESNPSPKMIQLTAYYMLKKKKPMLIFNNLIIFYTKQHRILEHSFYEILAKCFGYKDCDLASNFTYPCWSATIKPLLCQYNLRCLRLILNEHFKEYSALHELLDFSILSNS